MKKVIALFVLDLLVIALVAWRFCQAQPRHHVLGPTVHYNGYVLNHKAIDAMKHRTVLISWEGFGGIERGTGVLLDSRHVLTCYHVADGGSDEMLVYAFPGRYNVRGKYVYGSKQQDLAVVELESPLPSSGTVTFARGAYDGEPVSIIGNIRGAMKWFVSCGVISGGSERDLYTDGLVLGGDSGGPWINEKGEIVAISDWGLVDADGHELGINGGIRSSVITKFLYDMIGNIR